MNGNLKKAGIAAALALATVAVPVWAQGTPGPDAATTVTDTRDDMDYGWIGLLGLVGLLGLRRRPEDRTTTTTGTSSGNYSSNR